MMIAKRLMVGRFMMKSRSVGNKKGDQNERKEENLLGKNCKIARRI